jgi:hypothetical protein
LAERLGRDGRLPLSAAEIAQILGQARLLVGLAPEQVDAFVRRVEELADRYPETRQVQRSRLL